MRRICTILARGGSKGVPGKNLRPFLGQPLIARTVAQAKRTGLFAAVAVSSDSQAILDAATRAGADETVLRPSELAGDRAPKIPAICHCVAEVERRRGMRFDAVVDLAVTSPLRADEDVAGAVALLESSGAPNVLSCAEADQNPYYVVLELDADGQPHLSKTPPRPIYARQDAPHCLALNGAVFVWRRDAISADYLDVLQQGTRLYEMPRQRSVDIDTEVDFLVAEALAARSP